MKKYAIIVAGGSGTRMGTEMPKQFLRIHYKPILLHSLLKFSAIDKNIQIIVVLPENHISTWNKILKDESISVAHRIVAGGKERFDSVKNGLNLICEDGLVAIHDGVRPLVSEEVIKNCYHQAGLKGNAIPAVRVSESIREISIGKNQPVKREFFRLIQTPQTFRVSLIKKAYLQNYSNEFTDDATVLESIGESINLIEGNPENIKITTPDDLRIAKALF